jgi:hypothetical protein
MIVVNAAWNTLCGYGLPDGPPRPAPRSIDFTRVRDALATLDPLQLDSARQAMLFGWLDAWRHHWPSRFSDELGELGERLHSALAAQPVDRNRYLKLRRIAAENLASVL